MLSPAASGRDGAAEHRFARAPRRQAIDLRAHDALDEIRRARRKFQRTEQEALRLQHDLDPAAPDQRREAGGATARRPRSAIVAGMSSALAGASTANPPSSPSISRTTRGDTMRLSPAMTAAATLPVQAFRIAPMAAEKLHREEALLRRRAAVGICCATTIHDKARRRFREAGSRPRPPLRCPSGSSTSTVTR